MDTSANHPGSGEEFSPGQLVGQDRFQLIQELGRGGMGVVWLAKDLRLGEHVALKFLPRAISTDPVAIEDMRRETLKSRKLSHPNIVRIYDLYEAVGEAPFISMEYVTGSNLNVVRMQQPQHLFSWAYLKPLVEQVCDALDYAHSEKTIHRDIKPGNIMLDGQGRVKLADFGIAATISDTMSRTSLRNTTSGTLAYMSPQQMDGEIPKISDDIYAFGATLYELLTSRPPFYTGDVAHQVRSIPAKPMDERLADLELSNAIPPDEAAMVMACLSKDPKKRPVNARRVAEWVGLQVRRPRSPKAAAVEDYSDDDTLEAAVAGSQDYIKPFGTFRIKRSLFYLGVAVLGLAIVGISAGFLFSKRTLDNSTKESGALAATTPAADGEPAKPKPIVSTSTSATTSASKLLDPTFNIGEGPNDVLQCALLQPDGKILIGGRHVDISKQPSKHLSRLNPDGTQDTAFRFNAGANDTVHSLALQKDGKIIVGGNFTQYKGAPHNRLIRLNPNGTPDGSFRIGKGADGNVQCLAIQPDGKILLGGYFKNFGGASRRYLARVNTDGSLDRSFNIGTGADDNVRGIAIQKDGKILICGYFTNFNGETCGRVARLNPDGSLDKSFAVGSGANAPVLRVTLLPDDKILFTGAYSKFNDVDLINFVRLNSDGTRDASFTVKAGANQSVWSLIPLPNGQLILGGGFVRVNGKNIAGIARLQPDGTVDESLNVKFSADASVYSAFLQPDGKLVIAGKFDSVDGTPIRHIARLQRF